MSSRRSGAEDRRTRVLGELARVVADKGRTLRARMVKDGIAHTTGLDEVIDRLADDVEALAQAVAARADRVEVIHVHRQVRRWIMAAVVALALLVAGGWVLNRQAIHHAESEACRRAYETRVVLRQMVTVVAAANPAPPAGAAPEEVALHAQRLADADRFHNYALDRLALPDCRAQLGGPITSPR